MKVSVNKGYCYKFQRGKCTFGDKRRHRREIDPDYNKKEEGIVDKHNKDDNSKDKYKDKSSNRKPNRDGSKLYIPNNFDNRVVGLP